MAVTTEQVQVQVEINGQKAGSTIKELESSAKQLRKELKALPTDTDAFTKKAGELQKVNTQLKEINNSVKAVDKSLEETGKQGGFLKNALSGALSVFTGGGLLDIAEKALGTITDFFVGSVTAGKEAARSFAQLQAALNGNFEAATKLSDQAEELEKNLRGVFDAEDIKDAQTRLALYTQEQDQIESLTPKILDLAAAKGIDLASAADAVGKSLSGNGDALKKLGISVKDATSEEERFKILSDGLTASVDGQAKAISDSKTTAWDSLKVTWDDMVKGLGEKLLPMINSLGEFFVDLWNKAGPVVEVFKTIFGVFGQVWDSIKQLIASFGLFNDKASFAETLMKALAFALKPLQLVWQGLSYVIKGVSVALNELVAGANGTISALVSIFNNFKTFFTNLFSNIGEVIKGVFTLDADKIKEGIAGMKTAFTSMGGQIADAYNQGYNEVKERQQAALKADDEKQHNENMDKAAAQARELARKEADAKAAEDQKNKTKTDAQKAKDDAETLRKQTELASKLAELNNLVEDSRINAMKDGEEKAIAQENLRYQREQAAFVQRINDLRKAGADEATVKKANDEFLENSEQQHQDNLTDIKIKAAEKQAQDAKKSAADLEKEKEDDYKAQLDATNEFYDSLAIAIKQKLNDKVKAEGLTSDQIKTEKDKAGTALLELQIAKNEELLNIQKQFGQDTLATENEIADEKMDLAQRTADFKKQTEEATMDTVGEGLDFLIDTLSQDEEARKKNASLLKALNVAKITMDLYREVQGIWASVSELGPIAGPIIGAVQTALAVGRSVLAVSKMKSVKYARGGYTGNGIDIVDSTGEPVAGVVHAKEWVAPKWMTSHPVYNSVINHLEGVRQRGFASGGFTTTPVNNIQTNLDLMGTENKLDQILNAFREFPKTLKADVVYTEFETVAQNVNDVRNAAKVGS